MLSVENVGAYFILRSAVAFPNEVLFLRNLVLKHFLDFASVSVSGWQSHFAVEQSKSQFHCYMTGPLQVITLLR